MPIIIAAGAAYATYVSMKSSDMEMGEEVNLDEKTGINLLPFEHKLGLLEAPISTIAFFDGDYNLVAETLQLRVKDILKANPWLGGWLAKKKGEKEMKLWYDESGNEMAPGAFQVFEPGEIPLSRDTSYIEYADILKDTGVKVPSNKELLGKNLAMWRVSIIPDANDPQVRFALVVSMSHVSGDAATFYGLYQMLSPEADVVSMNPVRRSDAAEELIRRIGRESLSYITNAISNPIWEYTQVSDNPIQYSMFYVSETWLQKLHEEHNTDKDGTAVSDNSLLAYMFFKTMSKPTIGFMTYQLRNRFDDCPVSDTDAGNYNVSIPYTEIDYATPELLHESLKTGVRCGSDVPAPLPGFKWDATFSITTNWATHYKMPVNLGNDVEETLHMPLYDVRELKCIPSKLSLMCLFTTSAGGNEASKPRLGAFVVAPRSIMLEVEGSGIVDEPIVKY